MPTLVLAIVCLVLVGVLWRPLLLSSVLGEAGVARGVSPVWVQFGFLGVVALATTMTVPVVGTTLIFSLLIGPAAAARSFTVRPGVAVLFSVGFAVLIVWIAIAASYQSNWPVGFWVGTISATSYALGRIWAALAKRR